MSNASSYAVPSRNASVRHRLPAGSTLITHQRELGRGEPLSSEHDSFDPGGVADVVQGIATDENQVSPIAAGYDAKSLSARHAGADEPPGVARAGNKSLERCEACGDQFP